MIYYEASKQLEAFILAMAPPFEACVDAPSTYEELCKELDTHKPGGIEPVRVYSGGCYDTIFSEPKVNHALRAWHDLTHYNESLGFGLSDEIQVANMQVLDAEALAEEYDLTETDINVLWYELAGQRMYYDIHNEYVIEQNRFIANCVAFGLDETLESGEVF